MEWRRLWQHLVHAPWKVTRLFPPARLEETTRQIAASEGSHFGEIRLVIEGNWSMCRLLSKQTPRERAIYLFGCLRVWDTEDNTGVLVYLLMAERRIEIVADRGIARQVSQREWDAICTAMQQAFHRGEYIAGLQSGLVSITTLLNQHFPIGINQTNDNELPDFPVIL